jgi:phospholipase C
MRVWSYALSPGNSLQDAWQLANFDDKQYHLQVHGPNGFFREFTGDGNDPQVTVKCTYAKAAGNAQKLSGQLLIQLVNKGNAAYTVEISDNAYKTGARTQLLQAGESKDVLLDLAKSHGWYDCSVKIKGNRLFEQRYAGRVETGKAGFTDPLMGRV